MLKYEYTDRLQAISIGDGVTWINDLGQKCYTIVDGWATMGYEPMLLVAGYWSRDPAKCKTNHVSLRRVIESRRNGNVIRFPEELQSIDMPEIAL